MSIPLCKYLSVITASQFTKVNFKFQRHKMDHANMIASFKKCIPPLDGDNHKGQSGRIGVVGGSLEYTGAPYFAGICALRVGADLVHIFCAKSAANVIKSYSPELIVHPVLDAPDAITEISPWLDRLHVLIIGPGLGRAAETFNVVSELFKTVKEKRIPLIVDADGLFLVTERPELLKDFSSPIILTPNKIEFQRLHSKMSTSLNQLGEDIIILKKGKTDELLCSDVNVEWKSNLGGSGRRCGGQGDLLSGSIATMLHWTLNSYYNDSTSDKKLQLENVSIACFVASYLIRLCNEKAFQQKGRGMLASDMIEYISVVFQEFLEN